MADADEQAATDLLQELRGVIRRFGDADTAGNKRSFDQQMELRQRWITLVEQVQELGRKLSGKPDWSLFNDKAKLSIMEVIGDGDDLINKFLKDQHKISMMYLFYHPKFRAMAMENDGEKFTQPVLAKFKPDVTKYRRQVKNGHVCDHHEFMGNLHWSDDHPEHNEDRAARSLDEAKRVKIAVISKKVDSMRDYDPAIDIGRHPREFSAAQLEEIEEESDKRKKAIKENRVRERHAAYHKKTEWDRWVEERDDVWRYYPSTYREALEEWEKENPEPEINGSHLYYRRSTEVFQGNYVICKENQGTQLGEFLWCQELKVRRDIMGYLRRECGIDFLDIDENGYKVTAKTKVKLPVDHPFLDPEGSKHESEETRALVAAWWRGEVEEDFLKVELQELFVPPWEDKAPDMPGKFIMPFRDFKWPREGMFEFVVKKCLMWYDFNPLLKQVIGADTKPCTFLTWSDLPPGCDAKDFEWVYTAKTKIRLPIDHPLVTGVLIGPESAWGDKKEKSDMEVEFQELFEENSSLVWHRQFYWSFRWFEGARKHHEASKLKTAQKTTAQFVGDSP